jgi:hypothetical protein
MAYVYDAARQIRVEQFQEAAREARRCALRIDEIASLLDDRSETCECCTSVRYLNWPQRQFRSRVTGAAERLREIADVFERRAQDNDFLIGTSPAVLPVQS